MILVDTSVWIKVLRDRNGEIVQTFIDRIKDDVTLFTRFTQLELLQGSKDETEWNKLDEYLSTQYYLEATGSTWKEAARIYFELRRNGKTINSPIDCCIAQIAIESGAVLIHCDNDFTTIASIRPLVSEYFEI